MLRAAVRYGKTGDKKHLLRLPLEQRQLLEDVLPAAGGRAARQGNRPDRAVRSVAGEPAE